MNEISLFQKDRLKIYLFRAIMHNMKAKADGETYLHAHTHAHTHTRIQEGLMNSI